MFFFFYRQSSIETRELTNVYVISPASEVLKNLLLKASLPETILPEFHFFGRGGGGDGVEGRGGGVEG